MAFHAPSSNSQHRFPPLILLILLAFIPGAASWWFNADASLSDSPALVPANTTWGVFYDPKGIFCGSFDCYRILGLEAPHELPRGMLPPDTKVVTAAYRKMSRKWHPDKNGGDKLAKERFVKIAKAYEVLSSTETRKLYDYFRDRHDAYIQKYGSNVLWTYAPKSDVGGVVVFLFVILSILSYAMQKNKWRNVADHVVKAAYENLGPAHGGGRESAEVREAAMAEMAEENNRAMEGKSGREKKAAIRLMNATKAGSGGGSGKTPQQERLHKLIVEKVNKINDFGGGYHKPTIKDLLVLKLCLLPYSISRYFYWSACLFLKQKRGLDFTAEEVLILTKRTVGIVAWDAETDLGQADMLERELWVEENMKIWKREQELSTMSRTERKQAKKEKADFNE